MKTKLNLLLASLLIVTTSHAQDFGLSFSYFVPRHGYLSTPVSPFSIRGLGVDINRFIALETGATLYRMSGLGLKDLPFESKAPLVGPNFTLFVPAEIVFQLKGNKVQFDVKGGGFFFYGIDQKLNYGNFDRAIRDYEQWQVANADLTFKNHPGFGYHAGAELTVYVTNQVGVSLEANYLVGQAKFPVSGTYVGGQTTIEPEKTASYPDAKIDFTGYEFSVGLIFSSGGGSGGSKKPAYKRRRR
jgi:hypothetical protein